MSPRECHAEVTIVQLLDLIFERVSNGLISNSHDFTQPKRDGRHSIEMRNSNANSQIGYIINIAHSIEMQWGMFPPHIAHISEKLNRALQTSHRNPITIINITQKLLVIVKARSIPQLNRPAAQQRATTSCTINQSELR